MDALVQAFVKDLSVSTSASTSILNLIPSLKVTHICPEDATICQYEIPPSLINFLENYFCEDLFGEDKKLSFSDLDKEQSDFKQIFQYLFDYVYVILTSYFFSYNLPVSHLKILKDFTINQARSEHKFVFDKSHIYIKIFVPLEECLISFTYKNLPTDNFTLKPNNMYVIPYSLSTSIDLIEHKHIVFDICL